MERFLRELHHLVALCPGVQTAIHEWRGDDVRPVGQRRAEVVDAFAAVDHAHALADQFLLRVSCAKVIELLAPLINLVTEIHLDGTDGLARQAERAGRDVAGVSLCVAQHAEVDADGAGDEVTIRVAAAAPIDGASVHSRAAADAFQCFPVLGIADPL